MFPATRHHDEQDLTCVAHYQGFDAIEERKTKATAGQLKINGDCEEKE